MAALNDEVKHYIVKALACFDTPSQVADAVKQEFNITVTRQQCSTYDPTKHNGRNLSDKWRVIFEATRKKFIDDYSTIPISNRSYRLRVLGRIVESSHKNPMLVLQALEQAAKEVGDVFTNQSKRVLTGPDGKPVEVNFNNMSESEIDKRIAELERKLHEH